MATARGDPQQTTRAGTGEDGRGRGGHAVLVVELAELYFRQGLHERAIEVYRQVLEGIRPTRACARVCSRSRRQPGVPLSRAEAGRPRQALERTIAALEALLLALRRP